ncbi:MAG: ABC transporter permease subunit [Phycisphaeraceae bacterium]|nr:ABC transporter permease subunit [Phycisphaeraceae bacterium]MCW5761896.1 ABC transporter permease subunit [Phycisphaeraceae bacterium]
MPALLRWILTLGPTNPITVRLVQNGSRRKKHMYVRAAYLAVLILVLLWLLLLQTSSGTLNYRELARAGASSFTWIAYLQIGLICVIAPVFMAGAIAQESDSRTWDIMLTTPLSQLQVVLGNLFGRLFFVLALLMASLPLFAMTQYFGGVPGRSIFISYLIAGCASLLVGTSAIGLSVSRLVGKRAVFTFYIAVVSYIATTAAIDLWLRGAGLGAGASGRGVTWMTAFNPFLALHAVLNPSSYPSAEAGSLTGLTAFVLERPVVAWCTFSGGLSVLLIAASTVTVRLGGLGQLTSSRAGIPWYRKVMGLGGKHAEHRPPRTVWHNPIAWREALARNATFGRILARWSFLALGGVFGMLLIVLFHTGSLTQTTFQLALISTIWGEVAVVTLVGINMAATAITREREDGTLDLLLTTPITPRDYLRGKLRGLIAYLLPMLLVPIGTLLLAGLYVLFDGFGRSGGVDIPIVGRPGAGLTAPVLLPEAGLIAAPIMLTFTAFCVMVGLQWSLRSKGTISSVIATVGIVGVVGGTLGLCGWQSGTSIIFVGPALAAITPLTLVYALLNPAEALAETVTSSGGLTNARIGLFIGSIAGSGIYVAIVAGIMANMVRNFDFTVRKLSGTK